MKKGDLIIHRPRLASSEVVGMIVGRHQVSHGHPRSYLVLVEGEIKKLYMYELRRASFS